MIQTIPLSRLVPSPRNVRRRIDVAADLALKADIAARGLLQNLVVTAAKKPRGSFAVEAGERRRRALQALADDSELAADFEVPCLVLGSVGDAHEASLAENFQRLAMNPADECLAFGQLIEQGSDVEGVARRFGLTERFVEGRLRLAGLAPVVFEALGAGTISLDVAKAYAATADQERQAWVFEQMSGYGGQHPDSVRRMMTQATVSAGDRRARLVGEDVYLAAGGRIERDLFADDDDARWLDVALLERLANEKMDAAASDVLAASGLAFVRPTLDHYVGYGRLDGLARVPLDTPPLTDEEKAEIDRLQSEIDALALTLEDEDADPQAVDAAEALVDELAARIEAIADKSPVPGDEEKASLGAFLLLGDDGVPVLDRSYFREVGEGGEDDENEKGEDRPASGSDDGRMGGSLPEFQAPSLSQRLADELAIQRRDILAFHLAADPAVAFDLAVFVMADRVAGEGWRDQSGSSLTAVRPQDPVTGFTTPGAAATQGREQLREGLDRSWAGHETCVARFEAFRALPDAARQAWLGELVARTLEASLNAPGLRNRALHDHLGQVLGIEVARWWRPTGANYFDRAAKAVALDAMTEVGGAELAARYAKAKKAEVAGACERLFAGELVVEAEVRAAALAWVPEAMRFAVLDEETDLDQIDADSEPDLDDGDDTGVISPSAFDPSLGEDALAGETVVPVGEANTVAPVGEAGDRQPTDDGAENEPGEGAPVPAPLEEAA